MVTLDEVSGEVWKGSRHQRVYCVCAERGDAPSHYMTGLYQDRRLRCSAESRVSSEGAFVLANTMLDKQRRSTYHWIPRVESVPAEEVDVLDEHPIGGLVGLNVRGIGIGG